MADLPERFHIFVDQARPEAYLTYRHTRTFTSRFGQLLQSEDGRRALDTGQVDPLPFIPNPRMYGFLSPFTVSAMNEYRVEYDAEQARRVHFPTHPSRLSAVFAFDSADACEEVSRRYGWPLDSVRSFRLAEGVEHRVVRLNMSVISLLRAVYPVAMWTPEVLDPIWRHYWSGAGNLELEYPDLRHGQNWQRSESGVLWEWLIEGQVVSEDDSPVFGAA